MFKKYHSIIYPSDNAKIMGEKLTAFIVKCQENDIIINKITFEPDKSVIAEIVV